MKNQLLTSIFILFTLVSFSQEKSEEKVEKPEVKEDSKKDSKEDK